MKRAINKTEIETALVSHGFKRLKDGVLTWGDDGFFNGFEINVKPLFSNVYDVEVDQWFYDAAHGLMNENCDHEILSGANVLNYVIKHMKK